MNYHQYLLLLLLVVAVILFILQIIRYDLVAVIILLAAVFLGIIPFNNAFIGFSHSAFITVAAVFIISRAIENTGILAKLADVIRLRQRIIWKQLGIICLVEVAISSLINTAAATALMIPVAMKIARIKNIPAGILLMPLAFSALLGGLTTLIATPPNIIVSGYRLHHSGTSFSFFSFTPVGLTTALIGIAFIVFFGWKLIPLMKSKETEKPQRPARFTVDLKVHDSSPLIGKKLASIMEEFHDKFKLLALVREDREDEVIHEYLHHYTIQNNDAIILETDKWTLRELMHTYKLEIESSLKKKPASDHYLTEIILFPNSSLCGEEVAKLRLEQNYGFEIVAISRKDATLTQRLGHVVLEPGDVLLIRTDRKVSREEMEPLQCFILDASHIKAFSLKNTLKVFTIFGAAILAIVFGIPNDIALISAAVLMILTRCLNVEKAYLSLELPILILIAAMIPIGDAMETTGTAKLIAREIYTYGAPFPIWLNLFILIWGCILFSNVMINSAVALIFAPIALQIAAHWHASADPFLMGVAVGVSCTFLSPIGHPANTIILTPGDYRFSDYWHMGLPLTILVSIVATILISIVWPFYT